MSLYLKTSYHRTIFNIFRDNNFNQAIITLMKLYGIVLAPVIYLKYIGCAPMTFDIISLLIFVTH